MEFIHEYIDNIKKEAYKNIYNLENVVLNKNPYLSEFIDNYLKKKEKNNPSLLFIIKNIFIFYFKNIIRLVLYILNKFIYKLKYKKNKIDYSEELIIVDVFFLVDKIIKEKEFNENYLIGLYEILNRYSKKYVFLPRLYMDYKNPFSLFKLMNILNKNKHDFLFEYELLSYLDMFKILKFILFYPFIIIKLFQKKDTNIDKLFNYEIINSLSKTSHIAYTRYLVGQKLAIKLKNNSKIISWMEFQNLERTFYRAIHESQNDIKIYGCQFSIYYKEYLSMHITDVDYKFKITPNIILLNGKYNYSKSKQQVFKAGVSLRYKNLFNYSIGTGNNYDNTLILLTYEVNESIRLLKLVNDIDNIVIKIHPTTIVAQFNSYIKKSWEFSKLNIYEEFYRSNIVIVGSMSGTGLEAVACAKSVIIISSKDSITSNPLVEYGKGKIWDIAFNKNDVQRLYNELIEYRTKNIEEIKDIASWYKENFFIEPTEENIVKAFELGE